MARKIRQYRETIEAELEEVKRKLERIWHFIESIDLDMADDVVDILEYRHRREQLEVAAEKSRAVLAQTRELLDSAAVSAVVTQNMCELFKTSERTETQPFVRSSVKEVLVRPRRGDTCLYVSHARRSSHMGQGCHRTRYGRRNSQCVGFGGGPSESRPSRPSI